MRNSLNATFFQSQKSHYARTWCNWKGFQSHWLRNEWQISQNFWSCAKRTLRFNIFDKQIFLIYYISTFFVCKFQMVLQLMTSCINGNKMIPFNSLKVCFYPVVSSYPIILMANATSVPIQVVIAALLLIWLLKGSCLITYWPSTYPLWWLSWFRGCHSGWTINR